MLKNPKVVVSRPKYLYALASFCVHVCLDSRPPVHVSSMHSHNISCGVTDLTGRGEGGGEFLKDRSPS